MAHSDSAKAYLIAPAGPNHAEEVYAALEAAEDTAVQTVARVLSCDPAQLAVVGSLSHAMVNSMKMKPGEVRRI